MRTGLLSCLLLGAAATLAGCDSRHTATESGPAIQYEPAPEYSAMTLGGEPVSLAQMRGQPILLNVWATWCKPCLEEMPEFNALHRRYPGLGVIGVSIDAPEAEPAIRRFIADAGIEFTVWRDPDSLISNAFSFHALPFTILIDREGFIRWRHTGQIERDDPELTRHLDRVLRRAER